LAFRISPRFFKWSLEPTLFELYASQDDIHEIV